MNNGKTGQKTRRNRARVAPGSNAAPGQLLNNRALQAYLGVSAETLRQMKMETDFPAPFWRKYYSKVHVDAFLRSIPRSTHRKNLPGQSDEELIDRDADRILSEVFEGEWDQQFEKG